MSTLRIELTQVDGSGSSSAASGVYTGQIVVQSADGSLVVGDSNHYGSTPDPFSPEAVDRLILDEFDNVLDLGAYRVAERWSGVYASTPDRLMLVDTPEENVRIVIVTSGTGASTAFGIAEDVIGDMFGA